MASYEELAAEMVAQEPGWGPPSPGPLRLTVRPAGVASPPVNDLAEGQPWGAQGSEASRDEAAFQQGIRATPWFGEFVQKHGEQPNLNDPNYDYRKAWAAGARPDVRDPGDQMLHWSSEFKGENHPNRYVNGVDTITGQQQRKLPWLPRTEQQLGGLGRGLGALVEGARDWWNAPPAQPSPSPVSPRQPSDPTAGPRQMWQQGYPGTQPTGPGLVGQMAGDVLQIPHNMIEAGRVINSPAATPQQVQQARAQEGQGVAETAMNLWGFNAPFSAARKGATAGVFGGRIEPGRKAFAERLEQEGASKQEIWKQAGLTRFADKQWRQEIPDIAASYRGGVNDIAARIFDQQNPTRAGKYRTDGLDWPSVAAKQEAQRKIANGELVLGDVIPHHPELYGPYPELRNMPVSHDAMMEASGGYYRRSKEHPQGQIVYREEVDKNGKVKPRGLTFKTLIHEIEHAIANIEGFAKGSSAMVQNVDVAGSPARQMFDKMIAQFPQNMRTPQVIAETRSRAAHAAYNASAGEIPAKVAEIRADFTRDQLKAIEPTSMFRPKLEKQNVEYNPKYDPSAPDAKLGSVLNPTPVEMQMSIKPTLRGKAAEEAWRGTEKEPKLRTAVHPFSNVGGTPINEMQSPIIRGGKIINPRTIDIEKDLTNAELIFTGGDATGAGGKLHGSKDLPFETPVGRYGGPGYGSIMQGKPIAGHPGASPVWASMKGPMGEILNIARDVERRGKEPWQVYMTGGKQYLDSSMQMVDTAIQAAKSKGVSTAANEHLVKVMQSDGNKIKPDPGRPFPETGFKDETALKVWIDASPQPQRAKFVKAMDTKTARDLGFPNIGELRVWNTDPRMITAPPGSAGLTLSRIDPSIGLIPSHHPAYNTAVGGRDVSTLGMQVPHQIIAPTMHESRMSTLKKPQYYEQAPHLYFPGGGTHAAKTEPVTNELKDRLQKWMKENPGGLAVAGTAGGLGSLVDPSKYEAR